MKYIQRTKSKIKKDFVVGLLEDRQILRGRRENYRNYFSPTEDNLIPLSGMDNLSNAYQMLLKHLERGSHFYIVVDSDVDGYTSSALFYLYLQKIKDKFPNITVDYHIPLGKEHGLQTLMLDLAERKKYDIIVCPDSSSNDYKEHKTLKELGYDILVLDHHDAEAYSSDAVVVNNQLSLEYPNKFLSGVGVVWKLLQYCDEKFGVDYSSEYIDLVALGEISDMMDMNNLENRYILTEGLNKIENKFFKALIEKQSYSIGGKENLSQLDVAFYITPLINALIRVGTQSEKESLFLAFIDGDQIVQSTKRGEKGQQETLSTQVARNCVNARARQNREKEKAIDLLSIQIENDCLSNNKILILNADELDISNNLTGLCAMGVSSKYKKPVILGRVNSQGYLKGSMRGVNGSELKDFKGFLVSSGLMEYVEGHAQAAGASLKASDIDKLNAYANEQLKDLNFNEGFYEVDFVVNSQDEALGDLVFEVSNHKSIFGQGNPEPVLLIDNLVINNSEVQVIGQNANTLKFSCNGITYIKFHAEELIKQFKNSPETLKISVIGRCNINEWGGRQTPQIFIEDIEIKDAMDNF